MPLHLVAHSPAPPPPPPPPLPPQIRDQGFDLKFLNIGGGLGIDYMKK